MRLTVFVTAMTLWAAAFVSLPTPVHSQPALIEINSASQAQLESLSGIGVARAKVIIKHRPYKKTEEIVSKAGSPRPVYEANRSKLTVK